jgi:uncharacterized phage protein (TIGR01671 family)
MGKMETVKFRVWNGREMVYDIMAGKFGIFYVNPEKGDGLNTKDTACLSENTTKYHEGTPLMQYSGIDDKNGKEIYEGDIFKLGAEKEVFEVRFEHGCFMAFCNGKQYGLIGELQICFIDIIGNIYQNAGLL